MKQILFAKYNRTRRPEFQISTVIFEEAGVRKVAKTALTDAAVGHIEEMAASERLLSQTYPNLIFPKPEITDDKKTAVFPYLQGRLVDDYLKEVLGDRDSLQERMETFLSDIISVSPDQKCDFYRTDGFVEMFGDVDFEAETEAVKTANIDTISDNIMWTDNGICCLDYEWVCRFPVPIGYLRYRTLYYFYVRYREQLQKTYADRDFWRSFGINDDLRNRYAGMESAFQEYVHEKDHVYRYTDRYRRHTETMAELIGRKEILDCQEKRISVLQNEEEERNQHIARLDREIDQLRRQLEDCRGRNRELESRLESQNSCMEIREKRVSELEDLVMKKENHINNIQLGYERWIRLMRFKPVGFAFRAMYFAKRSVQGLKNRRNFEKLFVPECREPLVSIIIPVYNQFAYTYECIRSIIRFTENIPYEIIVGDDVSTDRTRHLERYICGIRVIHNDENMRFLLNCNQAAASASGKYIFFLNNDTRVTENWLGSLVELIESDESIGMVGSKFIYPDGRLQEAGGIIWKDASAWNYGNGQDPEESEFQYVRETDYISGAGIMIRKTLWNEIGGFDERFVPAYCEDSDLAFEVRKHGYKVVFQPESVIVHYEGVSNGTDLSSGQKKYQVDNQKKFYEKWKDVLEAEHVENGKDVFLSRDRSREKKHVLFIDHYVPQYDKDAGSKTTFMYLKMLVDKGYKITFLGDNFFHHEPYTARLQQMGIFVLYGPKYAMNSQQWLTDHLPFFDVVYLNRPHISIKYIDLVREYAKGKVIYYGHDLHFLRIRREADLTGKESLYREAEQWRTQEFYLMRKADVSYYPSVIEKEAIHEIDPGIPVKAITAYIYENFPRTSFCMEKREGILFVGGFVHTPNVDAVQWFTEKIYPAIYQRTGAPFFIVGSNPPEEITSIRKEGVVVKGFVSEEELRELYRSCRLAAVPLRYGAGVKGKVVESLYYGLPVVTTSVGAEGIEGIEAFACVCDREEDLIEAVCGIYDDEERLKNMAEESLDYVKKNFSPDAVWDKIREDFE